VTDLPPPETTPSLTVRLAFATARLVAARSSSAFLAAAAAARICGPPDWMPWLPVVPPWFGE
jgi:hypothetical protein